MIVFYIILIVVLIAALSLALFRVKRLNALVIQKEADLVRTHEESRVALERESDRIRNHYESEAVRIQVESQNDFEAQRVELEKQYNQVKAECESKTVQAQEMAKQAVSEAQAAVERQRLEAEVEVARVREHYESESRKVRESAEASMADVVRRFEPLRKYEAVLDFEAQAQRRLSDALQQADALEAEAKKVLETAKTAANRERAEIIQKANALKDEASTILNKAVLDSGRIVKEAEKRAEKIAGDAFVAMRDKHVLEDSIKALWNVVEGYGDRYIVPTRSLLDEMASDYGHTDAGVALKAARDVTRRMVEQGLSADCNYEESDRRERAKRFVTDAFNGRVDAVLSRCKHDNYGTLDREIRDAFSLVNLNGLVFRDARILPAYLDARLEELKWAVVVHELKLKAREEQRRIQEQMREEEKVRREHERAIREAKDKEDVIKSALERAQMEAEQASAQERTAYETRIAELSKRLAEAEAAKQREISMAQLTRAGNVYIISNIGSFGEDVFKIGMTRRREPMDRIWELSDASVPFDFDVHAMIYSEDAPALESLLHSEFEDLRVNKVNDRKEFFRIPLERIRQVVASKALNVTFTMMAEAREFRESQALAKLPAAETRYILSSKGNEEELNAKQMNIPIEGKLESSSLGLRK